MKDHFHQQFATCLNCVRTLCWQDNCICYYEVKIIAMKKMHVVAALIILFVLFYIIAPFIDISERSVFVLFSIAPFLIVCIVSLVLKYGNHGKTFNERFYEDLDVNE